MEHVITLESDYEYVIGSVMGNVLNLQAQFQNMEWAKSDLDLIAKELVNTAKLFAVQQGLGAASFVYDTSVNGNPVQIRQKRRNTGTLINSIHADVSGRTINFFNNANLGRGFYAGHIEYGFHDRGGNPVAARPFMRPAFQAVARASRGQIAGTLKDFLQNGLIFRNYASFGTPQRLSGDLRAFYNQPRGPIRGIGAGTYTTQGLRNSRLNRQSFWREGLTRGEMGVNKSNRIMGTVRDRDKTGFIGRPNDRGFLNGNTQTRSTWKYGSSKWGNRYSRTPEDYKGYGKMNKNIPGRSKITYNPSTTRSSSVKSTKTVKTSNTVSKPKTSKTYSLKQRTFGTETVYEKQFMTSDGRIHSSYREAEYHDFQNKLGGMISRSISERNVLTEKTISNYNSKPRNYRLTTKRR